MAAIQLGGEGSGCVVNEDVNRDVQAIKVVL